MTYKLVFETTDINELQRIVAAMNYSHSGVSMSATSFGIESPQPIVTKEERNALLDEAAPVVKRTRRTKAEIEAAEKAEHLATVFPTAEAVPATRPAGFDNLSSGAAPAQNAEAVTTSYDDVKRVTLELIRMKGKAVAMDVLKEVGAKTAMELKPVQYAEYVGLASAALGRE